MKACGRDVRQIMGDASLLKGLEPSEFTDEKFGLPTVKDILSELEKPGRDPRPEFKTATLQDGVEEISDLKPGMKLEGTVTNVTNFGAFVDVGVHQDGLVHVSQLADRFVDDPHKVVKAGDIVKVTVLEVDVPRKRISMTMKSQADYQGQRERGGQERGGQNRSGPGAEAPAARGPAAATARAEMAPWWRCTEVLRRRQRQQRLGRGTCRSDEQEEMTA